MVRVLCNHPLDIFDDRSAMTGVELLTFGRSCGHPTNPDVPYDIEFDASQGTFEELLAALPAGWRPDVVLIWWPDQEPLPEGLHLAPMPVVGVFSDYNLTLPYTCNLQGMFDVVVCDRPGRQVFSNLGYGDVRPFCQYTFKREFHYPRPGVARDLDIAFAGNLNPAVQRERAPWVARLSNLSAVGASVEIRQSVTPADYGHLLSRARIGFNRSIRGEMNLRGFEVPACGALLLMERSNQEVREFFVDGEECVLYGDDDFEQVVVDLLRDPARVGRIAAAGHRRVQDYSMGKRLPQLLAMLETPGPGRAQVDEATVALGRAEAMLLSWASPEAKTRAAMQAARLAPQSAAAINVLAMAALHLRGAQGAGQALELLRRSAGTDPSYLPAQRSIAMLLDSSDRLDLASQAHEEARHRLDRASSWQHLAGPSLPLGFSAEAVDWSLDLQQIVRERDPVGAR